MGVVLSHRVCDDWLCGSGKLFYMGSSESPTWNLLLHFTWFFGMEDAFSSSGHFPCYLCFPLHIDCFCWDPFAFLVALFREDLNWLQWDLPCDSHPLLWQTLGIFSMPILCSRSSCFCSLLPKQLVSPPLLFPDFSGWTLSEVHWAFLICLKLFGWSCESLFALVWDKRGSTILPIPWPGVLVRCTALTPE